MSCSFSGRRSVQRVPLSRPFACRPVQRVRRSPAGVGRLVRRVARERGRSALGSACVRCRSAVDASVGRRPAGIAALHDEAVGAQLAQPLADVGFAQAGVLCELLDVGWAAGERGEHACNRAAGDHGVGLGGRGVAHDRVKRSPSSSNTGRGSAAAVSAPSTVGMPDANASTARVPSGRRTYWQIRTRFSLRAEVTPICPSRSIVSRTGRRGCARRAARRRDGASRSRRVSRGQGRGG
jgi:hypothetical protein